MLFRSLSVWVVFIVSVLVGFAAGVRLNYVPNTSSADRPLQELVLFANNACYHIHHSMCFSLAIACMAFGRYVENPAVVAGAVGLLVGGALMDLLYPDWDLVTNNCHRAKILLFLERTGRGKA